MESIQIQPMKKVKIPCNHVLYLRPLNAQDGAVPTGTCGGCNIEDDGLGYYCSICSFKAHTNCIEWPDTVHHPTHSRHLLQKVSPHEIEYTDGQCHFCRNELTYPIYHCYLCDFSIDVYCWKSPPERMIYQPRSHEHTFTLIPRKDTFTCNACGEVGDRNPYVCVECGFMLHIGCIYLARVININRHDHRISRTYHLGHRDWESCGVCRKEMNWKLGGFMCKSCPSYAVHSMCAIRWDVWNGEELEDVPEEDEEIEDPYEVINDKEIIHFSHKQHKLRLGDDNEKMKCDACIFPINSEPFFKCMECKFFLHKKCASLPLKKRSILHRGKLYLQVHYKPRQVYKCESCVQYFDGFRYEAENETFDVRCGSVDEPFHHELHPHPLYRIFQVYAGCQNCRACGEDTKYFLSCTVCDFTLGMECATLPKKVKHICDAHDLSLHHGDDNSNAPLWCDICEEKTDPNVWFYGCDDCGTTLHVKCVTGDMYYLKPGNKYGKAELVANDGMTRPLCSVCKQRCRFSSFLRLIVSESVFAFACSLKCAQGG